MNFADVKRLVIPNGEVAAIACGAEILWRKQKYKKELLYLQSTGTQYIDTGVYLSNNHSVEFEYQLTTAPQYQKGIYGAYINGDRYELITRASGVSSNKGCLEYGYGSAAKVGLNTDTNKHIVRQEINTLYVDGVLFHTFANAIFEHSKSAPLGGFEYNGKYTPALAKYYYCKIWDGNTLARDFVPVLDWNDAPCMYDKVSGELFYNQGTGEFEYDDFSKNYEQVEYLESTGTQYIDTGLQLNQDSKLEMLISHIDPGAGTKVFGSRSSATENNFSIITGPVGGVASIVADFCNYQDNRLAYAHNENECRISINNKNLKINDSEIAVSTYADFATPENAYLFNCSGSYPTFYTQAVMRLYYCKIWDGNTIARDFIPCVRNSDSKPGLYDLVTETFFTNAGTGEFIYE